jgi:site-specific recombinase XerD
MRHPVDLDAAAVETFLSHLANEHDVSVSTQKQAAAALLFLYREVLDLRIELSDRVARPRRPRRLPAVLARVEAAAVLGELPGTPRLVAALLYGSGLRLLEALQLRLKDIDAERREIVVRSGKGGHDRVTMLPASLVPEVLRQMATLRTFT